jgi:Fe-S-cluster containining protein
MFVKNHCALRGGKMFKCLSNCAKCCGCVPIQRMVINKNRVHLQRRYRKIELKDGFIYPVTGDGYCIFLHKITFECQIYNERPEICMKYGTIPELLCPYVSMNGVERTEKEIKETIEQNSRTVDERLNKWLSRIEGCAGTPQPS